MESPTGDSTLKIYNSTIADNTALDEGAGIFRQGNIDIRNSTIARNTADDLGRRRRDRRHRLDARS